jgi:hypothetical protein
MSYPYLPLFVTANEVIDDKRRQLSVINRYDLIGNCRTHVALFTFANHELDIDIVLVTRMYTTARNPSMIRSPSQSSYIGRVVLSK